MHRVRRMEGTVMFIALCAIAFVVDLLAAGHLLVWGAKSHAVWAGQWYRLMTANFIHSGLTHILFNMYAVYVFGRIVENLSGRRGFFIVCLVGGSVGFLASLLALPDVFSVGASASVFALMGYTIHYRLRRLPLQWLPIDTAFLQILGLNVIMGLAVTNIDHFAHIGGFVGGFFTAGILGLPPSQFTHPRESTPVAERVFAAMMLIAFFWGGLSPLSFATTIGYGAPEFERAIAARYERYFTPLLVTDPNILWKDPTDHSDWEYVQTTLRRPPETPVAIAAFWRWVRGGGARREVTYRVVWERHDRDKGWQVVHTDRGQANTADPGPGRIFRRSVLSASDVEELAGQWRITVEVNGKPQYHFDFSITTTRVI